MKTIKKNIELIMITIFGLIMISLCFNRSLWGDEAWTTLLIQNDFGNMLRKISSDVHPPLYFIILKLVTMIFGENIIIMKIVSVLPMILLLFVSNYYIKKLFNNRLISIVFIILSGLAPSCLHMAVEIRMYSWSMLFVTWTGFLGYDIYLYNQMRDKILFALSGILAAYTHNFNIIAEIFVYGIFFIAISLKDKKAIKDIVLISLITIVGYLPCLLISFEQLSKVNDGFWLWPLNILDIAQMLIYPFNSLCHNEIPKIWILIFIGLPLLLASVLFLLMLYKIFIKKVINSDLIFGILCYIPMYGLIAFGIIYALLIRPIFVARYMHCTIGLYFLGISIAATYIEKKEYKIIVLILLICNIIYGYIFNFEREYLNGTEDTLRFMEEVKYDYDTRLIITDVYHFSTTILQYYEPEYDVIYNIDYDIYNTFEPLLYFADNETKKLDLDLLEQNSINYKKIYTGNIDNEYYFDIYLINY